VFGECSGHGFFFSVQAGVETTRCPLELGVFAHEGRQEITLRELRRPKSRCAWHAEDRREPLSELDEALRSIRQASKSVFKRNLREAAKTLLEGMLAVLAKKEKGVGQTWADDPFESTAKTVRITTLEIDRSHK
jgi:hypothetical protein